MVICCDLIPARAFGLLRAAGSSMVWAFLATTSHSRLRLRPHIKRADGLKSRQSFTPRYNKTKTTTFLATTSSCLPTNTTPIRLRCPYHQATKIRRHRIAAYSTKKLRSISRITTCASTVDRFSKQRCGDLERLSVRMWLMQPLAM